MTKAILKIVWNAIFYMKNVDLNESEVNRRNTSKTTFHLSFLKEKEYSHNFKASREEAIVMRHERIKINYLKKYLRKSFLVSLHIAWKVSKYGVISGPYFPVFGLNTGKYGPEITLFTQWQADILQFHYKLNSLQIIFRNFG